MGACGAAARRRRHAASLAVASLLSVLLLPSVAGEAPALGRPLQFDEKRMFKGISGAMLQLTANMRRAMAGELRHKPATQPRELNVSCLHSVAPEPLGWKMACPESHATVTQWVDAVGSTHRRIQLRPMPTMTADMVSWFLSPLFPGSLEIGGHTYTKQELWHPLDHVKRKIEFKLAPGKGLEPPAAMVRLDEAYRGADGGPSGHRTDLWLTVQDLPANLPRNRYVLAFDALGFQAFTVVIDQVDTPEGLVIALEFIVGAPARGYDAKQPGKGLLAPVAKAANTMLLEAVMAPYKNGELSDALDAVTRHAVEEWFNLPQFVPQAWERWSQQRRGAPELAAFKRSFLSMVTKSSGSGGAAGNATQQAVRTAARAARQA